MADTSEAGARAHGVRGMAIILVTAGLALTALYVVGSARIPIWRYFPSAEISVDFVQMLGPGWEWPTVTYLGFVGAAFATYAAALLAVWCGARATAVVVTFPILFALALIPMYPPTAVDMFHYHAMSRVFWIFGANPLTTPQGNLPYPIGLSWAELPSPYGPLWSLLSAPIALMGNNYLAGLIGFKVLAAISYLGCTGMIWQLVRNTRPGEESLAAVLFAWNPFVALRVLGNGHNDLWMMLLVLVALEAARRRHWTSSVLLLTLSVLVKYLSVLVGPPLLLYAWTHAGGSLRARLELLVSALGYAVALALMVYAPFWSGFDTVRGLLTESDRMITSTPVLLELFTSRVFGAPLADDLARLVPRLVFFALYLPLAWQARRSFSTLVLVSFTVFFLYLLLGAAWFRPWYMLWPVTIAALRPRSWLGGTLVAITVAASFPDLVEQFRNYWPWVSEYGRAVAAPILLAFLPPVVVWLTGVARYGGWSLDAERSSAPSDT